MVLDQVARSRPDLGRRDAMAGTENYTIDLVGEWPRVERDRQQPYREGLVPASGDELFTRRGARSALVVAKVAASIVAAFTAYLRLRAMSGSELGRAELLVCIAPMIGVAAFEISTARGASNPAADMVSALRASVVAIVTMLVVVPIVAGGSGLRVGLAFAAVLFPVRVIFCAIARGVVRRVSPPVRIVVLSSPTEDLQLRDDLLRQQLVPSTMIVSWQDVFPSEMSSFSENWLASAGKIWDPGDLVIVVGNGLIADDEHLQVMSRLEDLGARICSLDGFYESYLGRTRVGRGETLLLLLQLHEGRSTYGSVKSIIEVLCAMLGLVMLVVLGPWIALAIKATSRGPVLYRQERIGLHGRRFTLLKFRTMRTDAEDGGARFARPGDVRITRVGSFLRRARLDELPQLWNVLRREMSLIGPRPERPEFAEELSMLFPAYNKRLLVRPGITGWAQVNEAYASELDEHRRKLERDLYYVRHRSPTLDLQCLARTISPVLRLGGR